MPESALPRPGPAIKVVIITAAEDDHILTKALDAGCRGCVRKSAGIEDLIAAIESAHAGRVVIPAVLVERAMAASASRRTAPPTG